LYDFGDGSAGSNQQNAVHEYKNSGNYNVKLTVTDADGLTKTESITVTVNKSAYINQPQKFVDCTDVESGRYCQGCVDVGNDGSVCKSASGDCGSCSLNACLNSPQYSEKLLSLNVQANFEIL